MRTTKLNKTDLHHLVATSMAEIIGKHDPLFKKDKASELNEIIQAKLVELLAPKQGGGSSTKINEAGEVYCNYFKTYFPADEFNTKMSKPNKVTGERTEGYKANSKTAEVILRKIKVLKYNVEKQLMTNFMDKTITADEMSVIMDRLEEWTELTYTTAGAVPTVAEVIGLNTESKEYDEAMAASDAEEA